MAYPTRSKKSPSEVDPQFALQIARGSGPGQRTKGGRRAGGELQTTKVDVVHHVERIGAELDSPGARFVQHEFLAHRSVPDVQARAENHTRTGIAKSSRRRCPERGGVKPVIRS